MRARAGTWLFGTVLLEAAVAAWLSAFDTASVFYYSLVVAHVALGVPLVVALVLWLPEARRRGLLSTEPLCLLTAALALVALGTAGALAVTGTARPFRTLLMVHIAASVAALLSALAVAARRAAPRAALRATTVFGAACLALPLAGLLFAGLAPDPDNRIENPVRPPLSMDEEGGGPAGPFFPSSNLVEGSDLVPSDFFLESASCGNAGCHVDIVAQWDSSAHHRSSFNNQWYRKSIEYMQEVVGTRSSKWCGGCHDMAVLLTGRMDRPIVEQIDTPESQAGIGCLVCHSITAVRDTMGNGGFTLTYPEMHRLVASDSKAIHLLHDTMIRLDPAPHARTMLQPFHREQTGAFCSSCHKVHLDGPVNAYRWFRGFNEYDAWQNSGVSGGNARAFYYPPAPKDCADCHMPLVPSKDPGNIDGFVHSHRFPAANTALAVAYEDTEQLAITEQFLKAGVVTIDLFGLSRPAAGEADTGPLVTPSPSAEAATIGMTAALSADEGDVVAAGGIPAGPRRLTAPLGGEGAAEPAVDGAALVPGETVRVEVVARTRGVGHSFPGGTMDAFDTWIEFHAADATGRRLAWSGAVADGGRGAVEPSAHMYRTLLVDAHANPIDKRNAWAARAVVYARAIPPGAADTAHYTLEVPRDVVGPVTLTARINYRKFSDFYNRFSYLGERSRPPAEGEVTPDFDDVPFAWTGDPSKASGHLKELPEIPIIVMAEDRLVLPVAGSPEAGTGGAGQDASGPGGVPPPSHTELRPVGQVQPAAAPEGRRERFNDYGIGLLRQGDLRGAGAAFARVTEIEPTYADGWVNRARVAVQEGRHDEAAGWLDRALELAPDLASAHYFRALTLKSRGAYDEALAHLARARERFPEDREVLNQIGRLHYLKRDWAAAIAAFQATLRVDPEDLTAHYNLMLCQRGIGNLEEAAVEEKLYLRFKADESSQAIAGEYLRAHPHDNRERQAIHEHPPALSFESAAAPDPAGKPAQARSSSSSSLSGAGR